MKVNLLIFTIILFPTLCFGELFLEITKGSEDPYKVAVIPFNGDRSISNTINQIVTNNLKRTGEFKVFNNKKLLSQPQEEVEIIFNDFRTQSKSCTFQSGNKIFFVISKI